MTTIQTNCYGIKVTLGDPDPENPDTFLGGAIESDLLDGSESPEQKAAINGLESLVLAHACAGIDITSPQYEHGIDTAVQAIWNHYD